MSIINSVKSSKQLIKMARNIMFFDLETTGLPTRTNRTKSKYYPPEEIDKFDSSRIVSIGWMVFNEETQNLISKNHLIIYPDNFISNPKALEVHKITDEYAKQNGIPIKNVMNIFNKDLKICNKMIGYNVNFDYNILVSECYRAHHKTLLKQIKKITRVGGIKCAQKEAKYKIGIHNIIAKRKLYPRLEEVYRQLFNEPNFTTSHDAFDDTLRCAQIYFKLQKSV